MMSLLFAMLVEPFVTDVEKKNINLSDLGRQKKGDEKQKSDRLE